MIKKTSKIFFYVAALASVVALFIHAKGFFYPTELTPAWRHALFVFINIICIYGFLKRPKWFIWFVVILTLQQCFSHGSYALHLWQAENKIHWISVCDVIFLPVLVCLLFIERKTKSLTNSVHS